MRPLLAVVLLTTSACGAWTSAPEAKATKATAAATTAVAPDFTLTGLDGTSYSLAEQRGRTVVLEWYNPDCPFVAYAHGEGGPLRTQGEKAAEAGVVWWAINSNAPGTQGDDPARNRESLAEYDIDYPVLLDPDGTVGKAYGAITTPHMFVIAPDGSLAYEGALDDAPLGKASDGEVTNYVAAALEAVAAGEAAAPAKTRPYGCSVKY